MKKRLGSTTPRSARMRAAPGARELQEDLSPMTFREIVHGSDEYRRECDLRQEVLRQPLGLNLFDEDLDAEATQMHFGLFEAGVLLACVVAVPVSPGEARLRQMAVRPDMQGRGHGRRLIEHIEVELAARGHVTASLHARVSVVDFYRKLGFQSVGGEFLEVGIPHVKMFKTLAKPHPAIPLPP